MDDTKHRRHRGNLGDLAHHLQVHLSLRTWLHEGLSDMTGTLLTQLPDRGTHVMTHTPLRDTEPNRPGEISGKEITWTF